MKKYKLLRGLLAELDAARASREKVEAAAVGALRWFEEVDGIVYDWADDEGAREVMETLRAALREAQE